LNEEASCRYLSCLLPRQVRDIIPARMNDLAVVTKVLWAVNAAIEIFLLLLLIQRKSVREYPFFFAYISTDILLTLVTFYSYRRWGYDSFAGWTIAWVMQVAVITARAFAVAEICHNLFEDYRGVWELVRRILLGSGAMVLVYAVIGARHNWLLTMPNIQRALELSMATVLVGLFVFARYYEVQPPRDLGALAIGFLLFSCSAVLNVTLLERLLGKYTSLWTLLQMLAFLASVILWTQAMWQKQAVRVRATIHASSDAYRSLTPVVNMKLRLLNDQLSRLLKVEADQP
jgi:hypothetical protein